MINNPPCFKGLNTSIPIITPIKGRGFINQGSGLGFMVEGFRASLGFKVYRFFWAIARYSNSYRRRPYELYQPMN